MITKAVIIPAAMACILTFMLMLAISPTMDARKMAKLKMVNIFGKG
jgi:hypothetical protein